MATKFEKVINDLVALCGEDATKADLARRVQLVFPKVDIGLQDVNNWRTRGIPVAKCDAIEREFGYSKHLMRPEAFLPPPDAAA